MLPLSQHQELYESLGPGWPTQGDMFAVPNLTPPDKLTRYVIPLDGKSPKRQDGSYVNMKGTLANVVHVVNTAVVQAPNWIPADGRTLKVAEHMELFSLIGPYYGGDFTEFNIPKVEIEQEGFRPFICIRGEYPNRGWLTRR